MNPISNKLFWKYQKNKHIIDNVILRNAPEFVYRFNPPVLEGEIPVFTFHIALPDWFEEQCKFLSENRYKTMSAEELFYAMTSRGRPPKKSIFLTFDDGLKHVWTVVYPLLKKYGFRATCFLIPGCISEDDQRVRPTLDDYWDGRASLEEIMSLKNEKSSLATWPEIRIMHESGIIDFQSHTMYHSLVFISGKLFDFVHPGYNKHFYGNIHIPLYSENGKEVITRDAVLGLPIYCARPRMSAEKRYFDDENIRKRCVDTVEDLGGENFFKQKNWRNILKSVVSEINKTKKCHGRYESIEERDTAIFNELHNSRIMIEEKLPGKKVTHLCYPWYEAADFAVEASNRAGFKVNYFGTMRGRPTNRPGDNLFRMVRIEDLFLERLPGNGRKRLRDLFIKQYENRNILELLGI
jgi:hypothetical protein